jgi:plastocyanin
MNRRIRIVGLSALLIASAGCAIGAEKETRTEANASAQQPQSATAQVKIDNFSFAPATLEIKTGATVTWTNADDIPHTVVSDDKVFKSKALDTDDKFSFTFDKPGTYPYFCSLHPKMTAKVVVR